MAGIQWKGGKCHGAGEAKAMMRHACADERVLHTHSNKDIDTTRTEDNTDLLGLPYAGMCERYDARSEALRQATEDASGRALRKDAVTLLDAIIPVPRGLADAPAETQDAWYRDVMREIDRHYGADVVLDMKVHRDEIHEYEDADTGQRVISRAHAHCFCFPEVGGRLNAKAFTSRANMTALNREVDAMTRERYGCAYITGEKVADRRWQTVEQLKCASDVAEQEARASAATQEAAEAARAADESRSAARAARGDLEALEARKRALDVEVSRAVDASGRAARAAEDAEARRRAAEDGVAALARDVEGLRGQAAAARAEAAEAQRARDAAAEEAARSRQDAARAASEAKASRSATEALRAETGALEGRRDAALRELERLTDKVERAGEVLSTSEDAMLRAQEGASAAERRASEAEGRAVRARSDEAAAREDAESWGRIAEQRREQASTHLRELGVTREGLMGVLRKLARAVAELCVASWAGGRDWARGRWADWMGAEAPDAAWDLGVGEEKAREASDEELAAAARAVGREDALDDLRDAAGWWREDERGLDGGQARARDDDWER